MELRRYNTQLIHDSSIVETTTYTNVGSFAVKFCVVTLDNFREIYTHR